MQTLRPYRIPLIPLLMTALLALAGASPGNGQQLLVGDPTEIELTAPQLDVVSGTTQARLEQVRALVADRQWNEALDALRDAAAEKAQRLVEISPAAYVSVPTYCQLQISRFPPEGLAVYRRRYDAQAEPWYRDGLARRDERLLARVVDELFCSSWGDDALLASGELALERADYAAARRAWQAISPLLRDPQGRSTWQALRGIDIRRQWSKIEPRWHDRTTPRDWLAHPDTNLDLAAVRARLVLVSIREGDFERAALELEAFRRFHPQAVGRLAGQEGPYADLLAQILHAAREWPTDTAAADADWTAFARSPSRGGVAPGLGRVEFAGWSKPVDLPRHQAIPRVTGRTPIIFGGGRPRIMPTEPNETEDESLSYYPLVVDGRIYYGDARNIYSVDLATGRPAMTDDGVLYRLNAGTSTGRREIGRSGVAAGERSFTLSVTDGVLFARLGNETTGRINPRRDRRDERLVGIDLAREGLLTFQARPDDESWSFDGAPVTNGRQVFVTMRQSDVMPHVYVASFDAATGRRTWRTSIAAADTPAAGRGDEITHTLLTLVGERIYINTNLGVVAALACDDGRLCWLRRYDRTSRSLPARLPTYFGREPSPCVYDRGVLYVAPADTPAVFALDADTGQGLWTVYSLADTAHLLGVVDGKLIASGRRLWAVDAHSGRAAFVWPDSQTAGIRGFGRGVVAGSEIFWPTRDRIYVFDVATGRQTRQPIDISPYTDRGANLVAAGGYLLVVGRKRMMALGPRRAAPASPHPPDANQTEAVADRDGDRSRESSGDT